jgi:hypothetical protein
VAAPVPVAANEPPRQICASPYLVLLCDDSVTTGAFLPTSSHSPRHRNTDQPTRPGPNVFRAHRGLVTGIAVSALAVGVFAAPALASRPKNSVGHMAETATQAAALKQAGGSNSQTTGGLAGTTAAPGTASQAPSVSYTRGVGSLQSGSGSGGGAGAPTTKPTASKPPTTSTPTSTAPGTTTPRAPGITAAPGGGKFVPIYHDDFGSNSINKSTWGLYNGGAGTRAAANVIEHNGVLSLLSRKINGQWTGAGISSARSMLFTYGKFEFRAKLQRGMGTRAVALLWPQHGWPPEIDYFEMWDPTRVKDQLTNHYGKQNSMQHSGVQADFTQWHTVGLEWTPKAITYLLDGRVVAVQTGHVPHQPMWMGFQTTTGNSGKGDNPDKTTPAVVSWDIDYISAWKYAG